MPTEHHHVRIPPPILFLPAPLPWLLAMICLPTITAFGTTGPSGPPNPPNQLIQTAAIEPIEAISSPSDKPEQQANTQPTPDPTHPESPISASQSAPQSAGQEIPGQDNPEMAAPAKAGEPPTGVTKPTADQQEPEQLILPKEQHRWAKYQPGAWREVRITTETMRSEEEIAEKTDQKETSLSITTQREVLKTIDLDHYQLEVQATVNVGGKPIVGEWHTRLLDIITNHSARITRATNLEKTDIQVGDQTLSCAHWQLEASDQQRNFTFDLFYAPKTAPFFIQYRLAENPDSPDKPSRWTQTSQVIASTVPYLVCGKVIPCHCLRIVRQSNKGTMVQVAFHAEIVPGGVVAAWSTDTNIEGRPIRWRRLELVEYGIDK